MRNLARRLLDLPCGPVWPCLDRNVWIGFPAGDGGHAETRPTPAGFCFSPFPGYGRDRPPGCLRWRFPLSGQRFFGRPAGDKKARPGGRRSAPSPPFRQCGINGQRQNKWPRTTPNTRMKNFPFRVVCGAEVSPQAVQRDRRPAGPVRAGFPKEHDRRDAGPTIPARPSDVRTVPGRDSGVLFWVWFVGRRPPVPAAKGTGGIAPSAGFVSRSVPFFRGPRPAAANAIARAMPSARPAAAQTPFATPPIRLGVPAFPWATRATPFAAGAIPGAARPMRPGTKPSLPRGCRRPARRAVGGMAFSRRTASLIQGCFN